MVIRTRPKTESQIRNEIHKALKALKRVGKPVWWIKTHGHPMQRAGVPDFIVLFRGVLYGIEVKRPGGRTTRLQRNTLERIHEAGGVPLVVTSAFEAVEALLRSGGILERWVISRYLEPCTSAS